MFFKILVFQSQTKYRGCNKAECGGSTSVCTTTGSTSRSCQEGGMFRTIQSIKCNAKMSFINTVLCFSCKSHLWTMQSDFFHRFSYSCELFLEELGLLGQLQQNMRWRGEIFSCYILIWLFPFFKSIILFDKNHSKHVENHWNEKKMTSLLPVRHGPNREAAT